jgi:hypothetical protein
MEWSIIIGRSGLQLHSEPPLTKGLIISNNESLTMIIIPKCEVLSTKDWQRSLLNQMVE